MSNIIKIPRIYVKMFDKEALINSIFILFPARKLCKLLPFKKAKNIFILQNIITSWTLMGFGTFSCKFEKRILN